MVKKQSIFFVQYQDNILGASNEDDDIVWWENTATFSFDPTWTTLSVNTDADGAEAVFAADIDNDGDMDIVAALNRDNQVAWYENDGDPSDGGWTHNIIKDYADPCGSCGVMYDVFVVGMVLPQLRLPVSERASSHARRK